MAFYCIVQNFRVALSKVLVIVVCRIFVWSLVKCLLLYCAEFSYGT